jgi:DNA primase
MASFDSRTIEEIKARLDLVELVGRYVELKPVGDRWVAPCPFHQETKPSFSVNPAQGFFYCFGCQASGDIIDFYKDINGLDFPEAVEQLAREAGIELRAGGGKSSHRRRELRSVCLDLHSLASLYFREQLGGGAGREARAYLEGRHLTPEVLDRFGIGWAPAGWQNLQNHLGRQGYTPQQAVQAGLLSQSNNGRTYDRFRERIIFPITNLSGQTIAFGGRVIQADQDPKYLNSSETPIYRKSEHLYGLYQARRSMSHAKSGLLTEGYMDVLSLHQFGFTNSCGVLGTSLTPEQVHRLAGLVRRVDLVFDGDGPGRKATLRSAEMILCEGVQCRVVPLPEGEDVDSLLQSRGKDVLQKVIDSAQDGLAFCLEMVSAYHSPKEVMAWATGFVRKLKHLSLRAYYIPKIANGLGLSEVELRQALGAGEQGGGGAGARRLLMCGPAQRDRELLSFAIRYPEFIPRLRDRDMSAALCTSRGRELWNKLCRYEGDELLRRLDKGEKSFLVGCRVQPRDTSGERDREWQELVDFLDGSVTRKQQGNLKKALSRAQKEGDLEEVKRILSLYQNMIMH